jgi:hypothetical protein
LTPYFQHFAPPAENPTPLDFFPTGRAEISSAKDNNQILKGKKNFLFSGIGCIFGCL